MLDMKLRWNFEDKVEKHDRHLARISVGNSLKAEFKSHFMVINDFDFNSIMPKLF